MHRLHLGSRKRQGLRKFCHPVRPTRRVRRPGMQQGCGPVQRPGFGWCKPCSHPRHRAPALQGWKVLQELRLRRDRTQPGAAAGGRCAGRSSVSGVCRAACESHTSESTALRPGPPFNCGSVAAIVMHALCTIPHLQADSVSKRTNLRLQKYLKPSSHCPVSDIFGLIKNL